MDCKDLSNKKLFAFPRASAPFIIQLLLLMTFAAVALFGVNHVALYLPLVSLGGFLLVFSSAVPSPSFPRWLVAGWCLLVAWGLLQVLPLPASLSSLMHPLQVAAHHTISLTPQNGLLALLAWSGYAAAFAVAWRCGGAEKPAAGLLTGLGVSALFISLYGLLMHATGTASVLWLPKTMYQSDLTGTFINRNTYATFAGVGLLVTLSVALRRIGEVPSARRARWQERVKALHVLVIKPGWPWLLASSVIFGALLFSHSRAGLVATLLGLLVWLIGLLIGARGARPFLLLFAFLLAILGMAGLGSMGQTTLERLGSAGADAGVRQAIYTTTFTALADTPFTGTGLGSFEQAFRAYRTPELSLWITSRIDLAHNSWLQLGLEMGWPALALAVLLSLGLAYHFGRGLWRRRYGVIYPALGLAALVLTASHALVDFSPNIPGFSFFLAALLGLCAVQSLPAEARTATSSGPWVWLVAGGALFSIAGYLAVPALMTWCADATMARWQRGEEVPLKQLVAARKAYHRAIDWWPYAEWYRAVGYLNLRFAEHMPVVPAAVLRGVARQQLTSAVAVQPADPFTWQRLAVLELADPERAADALFNSIVSGPAEPLLLWARLPFIIKLWPQLAARDEALATDQLKLAWQQDAKRTEQTVRLLPGGLERLKLIPKPAQ